MGNTSSSFSGGSGRRSRHRNHQQPPQPELQTNNYIFAAATPYPPPPPPPPSGPYPPPPPPNPNYYHYHHPHGGGGYYPPPPPPPASMPMPLPAPYDHHHLAPGSAFGRYPCPPVPAPAPYVEHQKAVTIKNDVNVKKESIRVLPDVDNRGFFLVSFTFDATVPGSITVTYFAKEGAECKITPTQESLLPPVTVHFEQGLGQKFIQPSGTGIDFSLFEESNLLKKVDAEIYPLAIKADACLTDQTETNSEGNPVPAISNSQITQAVFDKDKGEYKVKVLKQILWVKGMRYELQEIYGIGNSVEGDFDGGDPGKECVICLSEPRDTTVLPCRHMCMCSGCAKVLRFQTNRCPICRQPVERLLEIKVSNGNNDETNNS